MPTPTLFIIFSILLRMVEGAGTAMYSTASYTLLTLLYPNRKGTTVVSGSINYQTLLLAWFFIGCGMEREGCVLLLALIPVHSVGFDTALYICGVHSWSSTRRRA